MPGQYGGLYQNYAAGGSNGDCAAGTGGGGAAASSSSAGPADDAGSPPSSATTKTGLRARLIVPDRDRPETREKVHRIRVTTSGGDGGEVDLRRDRSLCVLGCCGRGRLMIVWSTRDPRDTLERGPVNGLTANGGTSGSLHRVPSSDGGRNGNGGPTNGNSATATSGSTSGSAMTTWTSLEHAVASDDPIDAAATGSEKLGRLQFSISYDFEVSRRAIA